MAVPYKIGYDLRHSADNNVFTNQRIEPVVDRIRHLLAAKEESTHVLHHSFRDSTRPQKLFKRQRIHRRLTFIANRYRTRLHAFAALTVLVFDAKQRSRRDDIAAPVLRKKLKGSPCIGTVLNLVKKQQRAPWHNIQIPPNGRHARKDRIGIEIATEH